MKRTKRWLALLLAGMLAIPQMSVVKAEETVDLSYEGYEPFVTAVETLEELDAIEEILSDTVSLPGAEEISSQEEELSDRPADVPVYVEAGQTTAPSREKLIQYIEKNGEKEPDGWGGELYTCSLQSSMGGYVSLIWYAPKKELVLSYENSIETEVKRLFPSISVNLPENMNDPVHATFAIQSGAYGMAETVFYSANYHGTEDMNFVTLKSSFVYTTDAELHAEANKWLKNGYKVWDEALKKAIGAKRKRIAAQFLTEAAVLTSLGGVIGVVSGIVLSKVVSNVMETPTAVSIPACIVSVAFSMAIGIIFGLLPALKASKLNPIDALRSE